MTRSSRLVTDTNARLALPKPRQFPNSGAAGIDVGGNIDVDQIGLVGGDTLADGLAKITGAIDADTLDAAGARHGGEIRIVTFAGIGIVEVGRQFATAEIT